MELAVLDPDLMHISPSDWGDEEKRDKYLDFFSRIIDAICGDEFLALAWSQEIDELLFSCFTPPWILDSDWSNMIMPVYFKMTRDAEYFDCSDVDAISLLPDLECRLAEMGEIFLRLVHRMVSDERSVVFVMDPVRQSSYKVTCGCHEEFASFRCVRDVFRSSAAQSVGRICAGGTIGLVDLQEAVLSYIRAWMDGAEVVSSFAIDDGFARKFSRVIDRQERLSILKALALRVTLSRAEAVQKASLHDEHVYGSAERRFRVSAGRRIHYQERTDGAIHFVMYYRGSEHDDGL